ncbi:cytochrome P450 9e2-like isoform X2 [Nymphalis io]|nr:cytochrome P450 9e2-like isoform X2 [Nymphalis io]XP_050345939.1 cytochrome P450 9e2-like isoform X2 [Nymphalis io]XP_050345940.1 cytochrome P450 9e2-like isoform X2 [Nymphalis io]
MIILMIWIAVLLAVLGLYFHQTYSRFSKHGVKHMKIVPMFGNMLRVILRRDTLADDLDRIYYTFTKERFVGKYEFIKPTLIIRDLELVKKITVKDFEYFLDHRGFVDEKVEPLFARNIFVLKGEEWKDMRSMLSPAFTSSKIKLMVPFMEEVGKQMIQAINKKINESNTGAIDVDCKDLTTRFSNDVIASCAFGLKVDSFTDEKNKFYEMGKTATTFKLRHMLLFCFLAAFPSLSKKLKVTLFSKSTTDYFKELVLGTMRDREARNTIRPDIIHLLMEAKKGQLVHDDKEENANQKDTGFATVEESFVGKKTNNRVWSDIDLVAQAVLFFIAGFDTISTVMSFALHELAVHPEIQERLVQEIKNHNLKNGGKLDFTSIQRLTYLDMVTSEVLRLWPPGYALDRICVKDYNMGKPNSDATEDFIVRKGELIAIPLWCFHHDPKLFPDPMKFYPERFSEENKHNINPAAYMPFGLGPRNCIASRFGLCELKVLLYQIMLHIEISPSVKTCLPAKLSTESFNPRLVGGHWLQFKIRN